MSKPKQKEYAPSESEKLQASVAKAKYDEWEAVFEPAEDRFISDTQRDITSTLTGRASADVTQALDQSSEGTEYRQASGNMGNISALWNSAMVAQNDLATKTGGAVESNIMSDALEAVTNKSGVLSKNLAGAAKIGQSNVLNQAKNKLAVRNAYWNAGAKVLGSGLQAGISNVQGGGSFFTPNANQNVMGRLDFASMREGGGLNAYGTPDRPYLTMQARPATSLGERLRSNTGMTGLYNYPNMGFYNNTKTRK